MLSLAWTSFFVIIINFLIRNDRIKVDELFFFIKIWFLSLFLKCLDCFQKILERWLRICYPFLDKCIYLCITPKFLLATSIFSLKNQVLFLRFSKCFDWFILQWKLTNSLGCMCLEENSQVQVYSIISHEICL